MHKPVASRPAASTSEPRIVRLLLVVAALTCGVAALTHSVACTTESGSTPSCIMDETDAAHQNIEGGCNPHALCLDADGGTLPPLQCCAGETQLTLASCLQGYDAKCTSNGKEIDALTCCAAYAADAGSSDLDFCLHGFHAQCFDMNGTPVAKEQCCQGKTGNDHAFCLYAYGGDLPGSSSSSSGAGGSNTSSSSSSSTGSSSSGTGGAGPSDAGPG